MTLSVPTKPFTIQIHMTSDWHVGSGTGRGEIDSEVQRDADGLPYIPAKSLTGILRDGCEQVALALDGDERGKWYNWVNFLLGDQPNTLQRNRAEDCVQLEYEPRPAVVSIRSAYLPQTLKDALSTQPLEELLKQIEQQKNFPQVEKIQIAQKLKIKRQLNNAIAFIKPSVAIDPERGSAKSKALRFEEVVRMGAVLTSTSSLDFSGYQNITEDQAKLAYALLIAGTKMVERLGGKRRRGNGTCQISIVDDAKTNEWLEYLKENYDEKVDDPPQWEKPKLSSSSQSPEADSTWFNVPLTITTQSSIVLPKRTVGNVVECLDYIPGRYFLGYLHRVLGNHMNVSEAIARGDLLVTNATVEIDGIAGRPTPFCLFGEKLNGGLSKGRAVYNRFQEREPKDKQSKEIQTKGERSGYVGKFDGAKLPDSKTVKLEVNTHNTIDDEYQRPSSETRGAVYSYQAIPAQTTLKAALRLPQSIKDYLDTKSKDWRQNLSSNLRIGQSKKDQYGLVSVTTDQPNCFEISNQVGSDNLLYVWFLSDVLLRDDRLNPTTNPDIFKQVLEKELGLAKGSLEERSSSDLLSQMMRSRRTESWQVRWGLPRPSMLGWQAGSCVVYQIQGELNPKKLTELNAKLTELEAKGIGDRRAEGYGQICFNDPLLTTQLSHLKREEPESKPVLPELQAISERDPSFGYARIIETAAWREAIENKVLAIAANKNEREKILGLKIEGDKGYPTMSQLGGVRSNLKKLQSQDDISSVSIWIKSLCEKRADKWERTSDGLSKLSDLVTQPNTVWNCLESELSKLDFSNLVLTDPGVAALKKDLWAEAVRTLVDAIIRAHKRDLEKAQNKQQPESGEAA